MSASRDQSQKVAFVYSNLYQIYQKGKTAAQNADVSAAAEVAVEAPKPVAPEAPVAVAKAPATSNILKAEDAHAGKVSSYTPAELIGKRFARPASLPPQGAPKHAIVSLKDNLKALNDLHSRLRFMLQELEDLVRE